MTVPAEAPQVGALVRRGVSVIQWQYEQEAIEHEGLK